MDQLLNLILTGLEFLYGRPWLALCALILMFAWAGVLIHLSHRRIDPYLKAARARGAALKSSLGESGDPVAERGSFAENYLQVSGALNEAQPGADGLVQAWREFHETIIDESASPIRNTTRPGSYFHRAAPRLTNLIFASNAFVAAGLILTFIGLVVALHTAAGNMGDVDRAKSALALLLTVASAKFLTSIGGIGSSLWLRFAEHRLTRKVNGETEAICALLERGLLYIPAQRLAVEQLDVLKEQREQLKFFNTDVAMQLSERIGVQFQQAIAPVTASLSQLNDNMSSMSQGLGQSAAKAIEEATGGELRALGHTLANLGERLDALSSSVGSSGEEAAQQIRAAGADFAKAASDIRDAFDRLATQVDGMGGQLAEQGEAAARVQTEALDRVLAGLEQAQNRSAEVMAEAVKTFQAAGAETAETMQREVSAALASGVAESQRTFQVALDESGEALRGTAGDLTRAVGDAAEQIERASAGFVRSGEGAARTADAMQDVANNARTTAESLGDAARGLSAASTPVARAAEAINEAVTQTARTVQAARAREAEAFEALNDLVDGIRETQTAAETAWRDYRARFEGVDKALEATAVKLGQTLGDSFDEFRRFAKELDSELGAAVSKLSNALTAIEDYAGSLDEFVDQERRTMSAAE
jgi:ABC-type transporter Mla subunit MlaD